MKRNIDNSFVVDTGSLFNLFLIDSKCIVLEAVHKSFILDLTFYEPGGVFVKGNDGHIKNLNNNEYCFIYRFNFLSFGICIFSLPVSFYIMH